MSGLYGKYIVTRVDGSSGTGKKHELCAYFVLDLEHDEYAIPALKAYAKACKATHPDLAKDLLALVEADRAEQAARCNCREIGCPHSLGQSFASSANQTAYELMAKSKKEQK